MTGVLELKRVVTGVGGDNCTDHSTKESDSLSHTNDDNVSELQRVSIVVTVQITPPADLSNPYSTTHAMWKQSAEETVSVVLDLLVLFTLVYL